MGDFTDFKTIKVLQKPTKRFHGLMSLCNVLMGTTFYVSLTHFQLNYCLNSPQKRINDLDSKDSDYDLLNFIFMVFDENNDPYSFV